MGRRFHFICDGCGDKREQASPSLPQSWADLDVEISGLTNWTGGGPYKQARLVACATCQIRLQEILRNFPILPILFEALPILRDTRKAFADYDAALERREHGGVAMNQCHHDIRRLLEPRLYEPAGGKAGEGQ